MVNWREDNLQSLFNEMSKTMPADTPSALSDQQYLDVLALVLQKNGFPEGRRELTVDVLRNVQRTGRNGPEPFAERRTCAGVWVPSRGEGTSSTLSKTPPLARTRTV
jgi:hypothetical protein